MPHSKGYGTARRRAAATRQIGDVVDSLMAQEVFSRGMPVAELASKWPQIVGERLAAETSPLSFEDGVLTRGGLQRAMGGAGEVPARGDPGAAPTRRSAAAKVRAREDRRPGSMRNGKTAGRRPYLVTRSRSNGLLFG